MSEQDRNENNTISMTDIAGKDSKEDSRKSGSRRRYDIVIIGSGPAGIQAAIHTARSKMSVALMGKVTESALWKAHVENYFGRKSMSGKEMLLSGLEDAKSFGANIIEKDCIKVFLQTEDDGYPFTIHCEDKEVIEARTVILSKGVSRKKLNLPNEEAFVGKGVSYCAECDCRFYKGKAVAVVGNGSAAKHSAELLLQYASRVWLLIGGQPSEGKNEATVYPKHEKLQVLADWPQTLLGDEKLKGITTVNGMTIEADGLFIEMGSVGAIELLSETGLFPDENGHIEVNREMETGVKGIFACGDITGTPYQVAKAVGEGCVAGLNAAQIAREISSKGYKAMRNSGK